MCLHAHNLHRLAYRVTLCVCVCVSVYVTAAERIDEEEEVNKNRMIMKATCMFNDFLRLPLITQTEYNTVINFRFPSPTTKYEFFFFFIAHLLTLSLHSVYMRFSSNTHYELKMQIVRQSFVSHFMFLSYGKRRTCFFLSIFCFCFYLLSLLAERHLGRKLHFE